MRNHFYLPAAAIAAAVLFASCTKEQSSLTIDSIQGSATIYGTALYDEGTVKNESGAIIETNVVAAAGQTVLVKVSNSSYASNTQGYQSYLGSVKDDGSFEISIPVGSNDASAEVSILPFKASYHKNINGEIVTIDSVLFATPTPTNVSLSDQSGVFVTLTAENQTESQTQYNQTVTVSGTVTAPGWRDISETEKEGTYMAYSGASLIITVRISDREGVLNTFTYNCTSDNSGEYTQEISLPDEFFSESGMTAEIKAATAAFQNDFTHHYKITPSDGSSPLWQEQLISLNYWSSSVETTLDDTNKANYQNIPLSLDEIRIDTDPVNLEEVYGLGFSIDNNIPNYSVGLYDPFEWR